MRRLLVLASLSTTLFATAALAVPEAASAGRIERGAAPKDGTVSLRRTLASVLVLKKLAPTSDQKREMLSIIAEAKVLREKTRNAVPENQRRIVLEKAIADARATGVVSPQTKEEMKSMRAKVAAESSGGERKELRERMQKLFTPEQIEKMRAGRDKKHARRAGKKAAWVRLMMSDEFAAELAK